MWMEKIPPRKTTPIYSLILIKENIQHFLPLDRARKRNTTRKSKRQHFSLASSDANYDPRNAILINSNWYTTCSNKKATASVNTIPRESTTISAQFFSVNCITPAINLWMFITKILQFGVKNKRYYYVWLACWTQV